MSECRSNMPTNFCKTYPDSRCVVYTGSNLLCTGINTNDRLEEILAKIDAKICTSEGTGTVTQVISGDGMDFSTIITTGYVTLGTPSSVTLSSTNSISSTSHTHSFAPGGTTSQYIRGDGSLATYGTGLSYWSKTGDAGTVAGTNFLGTTDAQSLVFKLNGIKWGRLDYTYGNVIFGSSAGDANTTGFGNVFLGTSVGVMNTAGYSNFAGGANAFSDNTIGYENTVAGNAGLNSNTTGHRNIAIGSNAGGRNTTASDQLFINSIIRASYSDDQAKSIIYGVQNASAISQQLYLNSQVYLPYISNVGNDQVMGRSSSDGQIGYLTLAGGLSLNLGTLTSSTVATAVPLSGITAATVGNTINNADFNQLWNWNTLSSGSALKLASISTGAASNGQMLLDIQLSGTNSNSNQTTYGASISNIHSGTGSLNRALYVTASGGATNQAIFVNAGSVNMNALTASQLVATDASKNLTNVTALPNGTTATTQSAGDNSTKVATTAYVATAVAAVPSGLTVGTTTIASGTTTRILYDNAGVLGEYTLSGTGTTVPMTASPTFTGTVIAPAITGGIAANDDITIEGTSNGTKTTSYVNMQTTGGLVGIGTTTPVKALNVVGGDVQIGATLTSGNLNPANYRTFTIGTDLTSAALQMGGGGTGVMWGAVYANVGGISVYGNSLPISFETPSQRLLLAVNGAAAFSNAVTTGTNTTAGLSVISNSLTTGNGVDIRSSSVTSGNLASIISTSTAAASNTLTGLNIAISGANGTNAQTVRGQIISVTNTNATSGTNTALTLTASGATTANTALNVTAGTVNLAAAVPLNIASGTNSRAGNATLVGGSVTVSNTTVTANTIVILTRKVSGGTLGTAITYTLSAGNSFTINSDNILDTSTFSYMLIENN